MLSNIGSIKDFLVGEITELQYEGFLYEGFLYRQQNIEVSPFDKGVLIGKEWAYEKVLDFIKNMEEAQEENK